MTVPTLLARPSVLSKVFFSCTSSDWVCFSDGLCTRHVDVVAFSSVERIMCATRRRSGAYSHGGPIRRRKRGYILTMDQSDPRVRQLDGCGERLFQTLSLVN
eukprot:542540-Pyramimonas_sp.AAC.1